MNTYILAAGEDVIIKIRNPCIFVWLGCVKIEKNYQKKMFYINKLTELPGT
jgi:hypothetical protein